MFDRLKSFWRQLGELPRGLSWLLVEIFFPLQCLGCAAEGVVLCDVCLDKIKLDEAVVEKIGELDGLWVAACDYRELDQYVWLLKYQFVTELAAPLGGLMSKRLKAEKMVFGGDFILQPVPLHRRRERERGFNQAKLLADFVGRNLGLPVKDLIIRKRHTRPQVNLGRKDRLKNMVDAFKVEGDVLGAIVVLVDDVYTTGATTNECAKVLKAAGAARVYGLVLARG